MKAMTDRYQEIRDALAMGPTPGPWEVLNGTDVFTQLGARNAAGVEAAANDGWHIADCDMGPSSTEEGEADIPYVEKRANAAHIAACDPDTIRELLAERDALAAEVERLEEAVRGWWEEHRPVGWTEDQHRTWPYVNLTTATEKALVDALLRDQEEGHEQ